MHLDRDLFAKSDQLINNILLPIYKQNPFFFSVTIMDIQDIFIKQVVQLKHIKQLRELFMIKKVYQQSR